MTVIITVWITNRLNDQVKNRTSLRSVNAEGKTNPIKIKPNFASLTSIITNLDINIEHLLDKFTTSYQCKLLHYIQSIPQQSI